MADNRLPTALQDFLFDLNGYLVLKNAVEPDLLDRLNAAVDALPKIEMGGWLGNSMRRDYTGDTGLEMHNVVELGGPFEELLDHPSWIESCRHYAGEENSYIQGLFVDECMLSVRNAGGHHPVHSGGYQTPLRGLYRYDNGVFRCGQVNVILALTDVHEGDGPTMVVPSSHKSNLPHPTMGDYARGDRMDALDGAVPVYLDKGDALLFCDGLMHGGSSRVNPGERRVTIYRYGPAWGATRFGFEYSKTLLDRLTPERRKLLEPVTPLRPPASP